jgi:hypothetical protein
MVYSNPRDSPPPAAEGVKRVSGDTPIGVNLRKKYLNNRKNEPGRV